MSILNGMSYDEASTYISRLRDRADRLTDKVDRKKAQIEEANQELEAIRLQVNELIVPAEPRASVLTFRKTYGRDEKVYRFAAIKSDDGLWYVTGGNSRKGPGGLTWEHLVKLIRGGERPGTVTNVCVYRYHNDHVEIFTP